MINTKVGDAGKLRKALIDVVKRLEAYVGCDHHTFHPTATTCDGITSVGKCGKIGTCAAIFKARAALAAPRRNCDIGTAEERTKRYHEFCRGRMCETCPALTAEMDDSQDGSCIIQWEDMAYVESDEAAQVKEGEAK